jgi:hypothetical protein
MWWNGFMLVGLLGIAVCAALMFFMIRDAHRDRSGRSG